MRHGRRHDAGIDREWANLATVEPVRRLDFQRWATSALGAVDSPPTFAAFDGNTDDILTRDEFESRLREEFASLDANADGVLERAELTFQVQAPPAGDRRPPRR